MSFNRYQALATKAAKLIRSRFTPWTALNEAVETYRRQGRHVAILIEWLRKEWEDSDPSKASSRTTQSMWELAGELLRVKRELVMVFAKVSGNDPREVLETLRDMEASNHRIEQPEAEE